MRRPHRSSSRVATGTGRDRVVKDLEAIWITIASKVDVRARAYRVKLLRGAGILAAVALVTEFLAQPLRAFRVQPLAGDFDALTGAARLLVQGQGHLLYSPLAQVAAESAYTGMHLPGDGQLFVNPPPAAAVLIPLVVLPFRIALAVFTAASIACVGLSAWLLLRRVLRRPMLSTAGLVVIASTVSVASGWNLVMANWDAILLLGLSLAIIALEARHPLGAGLLLSILLIKPQVIWLVPITLMAARQWRVLLGLLIGALVWTVGSLLLVGPAALVQGVHLALTLGGLQASAATGLPGLVAQVSPGGMATNLCLALGLLAVSLLTWRLRACLRADRSLAIALGVAVSLLLAPHVLATDLSLLGIPIVLWARRAPYPALWSSLLLNAVVWPYASGIGSPAEIHLALIPQLVVLTGVVWALTGHPAARDPGGRSIRETAVGVGPPEVAAVAQAAG